MIGPADAPRSVAGVGIDAVDVDRFRRVLERRPSVAARMFTDAERADAAASGDPAQRLAARFAAKEATMKALGRGLGAFALREVEVVRSTGPGSARGAPSLRLSGSAHQVATASAVSRWHLSMTHTAQVAMAVVVAESRAG
jgi:holo-[acyl-carrier protein] synthase